MIIYDPELGEIDTENFTKEQQDKIKRFAKIYGYDLSEENEYMKVMRKKG
jgi:hypothetical protein